MTMFPRRIRTAAFGIGTAALLMVSGMGPASAHVGVKADTTAAGSTAMVTFGFGHGCGESPTTSLTFQIPEEFSGVTPVFEAGWDIELVSDDLATPVTDAHGEEITERVSEVIYTADEAIPDGIYGQVTLRLSLPEDASGETIYFPVIQTCEDGEEAWIEIPAEGQDEDELESPAPSITVTDAEEGNGH
jgi:periplasmic copper chaperone A